MKNSHFFEVSNEQSQVKSAIVSKYFVSWARVMINSQNKNISGSNHRIAYIDLFAGPGRFNDGTDSTPLKILKTAVQDDVIRNRLVSVFNDKDRSNTISLQKAIEEIPGINTLKYPPKVLTSVVDQEIVEVFNGIGLVPTLLFVDPWGYKGLTRSLIYSVVKDWGCDCVFFFNYNRINMGLNNSVLKSHMAALFGESEVEMLSSSLKTLDPEEREKTILDSICKSLRSLGLRYMLPFRFKDAYGSRTSHFLVLVSKHFKGYEIMKDIMAKHSSYETEGVATFEYSPHKQLPLFSLTSPIDELGKMLLAEYAGKTLTMQQIYKLHSVDRPFTKSNYKKALLLLESREQIKTTPHKSGTFADKVKVTF